METLIIQIIIDVINHSGFFFNVFSHQQATIKFNIINLSISTSFLSLRMPISIFSIKENKKKNLGWEYIYDGISYYKTRKVTKANKFYTLSFSYNFKKKEDIVYFAYSIPYTYSYLSEFLNNFLIQNNFQKSY